MKHVTKSGAVLAAAALSLVMSGMTVSTTAQAEEAKVHCTGANACKGTSECKTASSSCKGQNACKGQGWTSVSTADCTAAGGKVEG